MFCGHALHRIRSVVSEYVCLLAMHHDAVQYFLYGTFAWLLHLLFCVLISFIVRASCFALLLRRLICLILFVCLRGFFCPTALQSYFHWTTAWPPTKPAKDLSPHQSHYSRYIQESKVAPRVAVWPQMTGYVVSPFNFEDILFEAS